MAGGAEDYLGASDWEDDDLLSIEEASGRLKEELAVISAQLGEVSGKERSRLEARVAALRECLQLQRVSRWEDYRSGMRGRPARH